MKTDECVGILLYLRFFFLKSFQGLIFTLSLNTHQKSKISKASFLFYSLTLWMLWRQAYRTDAYMHTHTTDTTFKILFVVVTIQLTYYSIQFSSIQLYL